MRITPEDIGTFIYCPFLWAKGKNIYESLNLFEHNVSNAIICAEEKCLINSSNISSRKILQQWDKLWWPTLAENNVQFEEGQKLSVKAAVIFADYAKYDVATDTTLTTNLELAINFNHTILSTKADIIKVDLAKPYKNVNILNFSNKDLTVSEIINNPKIQTTAYIFAQNDIDVIGYTHIYIDIKNSKTKMTMASFRKNELQSITKMIKFAIYGMKLGVDHINPWQCTGCNLCKNSK